MKNKAICLVILVFIILGLNLYTNQVCATIYTYSVSGNGGTVSKKNLVLDIHPTEQLVATLKLDDVEVKDANVIWKSSDETVATVDNTGKIVAKKAGTATITTEFIDIGESHKIEITVYNAPEFTDMSNAKYEVFYEGTQNASLKISNLNFKENTMMNYKCIITKSPNKPDLIFESNGYVDDKKNENCFYLDENIDGGYLFDRDITSFIELNQDLYCWVVETKKLENAYFSEDGEEKTYVSKIINEGYKLTRPELPKYNGLFFASYVCKTRTQIIYKIPGISQRKFKIKIGKISDNEILKKIKNKESDGFAKLEDYAKINTPIYEEVVKSTREKSVEYNGNFEIPLDGKLEQGEYYYLYTEFDDENGKYYPIEHCLTLAQADVYKEQDSWYLFFYGDDSFKWKDFSTSSVNNDIKPKTDPEEDTTVAQNKPLPKTGIGMMMVGIISSVAIIGVISYCKTNKYSGI